MAGLKKHENRERMMDIGGMKMKLRAEIWAKVSGQKVV